MGRDNAPKRNFRFLTPYTKYLKLDNNLSRYRKYTENDSILYNKHVLKNYELLMKDDRLAYDLQNAIHLRRFKLRNYSSVLNESNELILEIDKELKRLEN